MKAPIDLVCEGRIAEPSFSRARAKTCYHCDHFIYVGRNGWRCKKLDLFFGKGEDPPLAAEMTCDKWKNDHPLGLEERLV